MLRKIAALILLLYHYSGFTFPVSKDPIKFNSDTLDLKRKIAPKIQNNNVAIQPSSRSCGYQIQFTAGVLAGKTKIGNEYTMSFHISNGFQFTNGFYLGVGCGAEHLVVPVIPAFGEITYRFIDNQFAPFIFIKSGYGFAFIDKNDHPYYYDDYNNDYPYDSKGGLMFNTGMGIANYTWEKVAVVVALGYRFQRVTETERMWNGMQRERISKIKSIEVKFGFIFR